MTQSYLLQRSHTHRFDNLPNSSVYVRDSGLAYLDASRQWGHEILAPLHHAAQLQPIAA